VLGNPLPYDTYRTGPDSKTMPVGEAFA
jgi:hypothetical protein